MKLVDQIDKAKKFVSILYAIDYLREALVPFRLELSESINLVTNTDTNNWMVQIIRLDGKKWYLSE